MMVFFIFYVEHFLQAFHHLQWQSDVLRLKQKLSLKEIQQVKSILNCMQGDVMTRYKDLDSVKMGCGRAASCVGKLQI